MRESGFHVAHDASVQPSRSSSGQAPASTHQSAPLYPHLLQRKASCPCGGGCSLCAPARPGSSDGEPLPTSLRSRFEAIQRADFSRVRVHPHAPEVTGPLRARGVTHGQDIFFHPGEFQPGTSPGEALIGHELAHTLQTRRSENASQQAAFISQPGDSLERNADVLASGTTAPILAAPSGAVLCSPFDSESADERSRRERLLQSIRHALDRLLHLLRTGGLLANVEVDVERAGVRGVIYGAHTAGTPDEEFVTYSDRDARLRRIIRSLIAMATAYRSAPIPADFSAPTQLNTGEYESLVFPPVGGSISYSSYGGPTAEWTDLQAAYARYRFAQGQTEEEFFTDWYYLDPAGRVLPSAARGALRIGRGTPVGVYVVVPDIEHDPLDYQRLDGFSPIPEGSRIIEIWHDDFGYYYMYHGQRIDVPDPWQ